MWRNGSAADAESAGRGVPLVDRVLRARGFTDVDAIARFCDPKLTDLHEPGLLPAIDVAAQRIAEAIRAKQSIIIYGDYDVDGITATAILYHVIKAIDAEAKVRSYVPPSH